MIHIEIQSNPFHELPFLNAQSKRQGAAWARLPFFRGTLRGLPAGTPPLLLTGDLQGRLDYGDDEETLLGCAVPEIYFDQEIEQDLPMIEEVVAILAGDFYTLPNASKRGGTGDVRRVWEAFAEAFGEVVGVAGNHDVFSGREGLGNSLSERRPPGLLDGRLIESGSFKLAGLSGVPGKSNKPNRKPWWEFKQGLLDLLAARPDVLIMHPSPSVDDDHVGSETLAELIMESGFAGLVVCGHVPWKHRLQKVGRATCLNVHEAVILLEPE